MHDALGGLVFHQQLPYNLQTLFMEKWGALAPSRPPLPGRWRAGEQGPSSGTLALACRTRP